MCELVADYHVDLTEPAAELIEANRARLNEPPGINGDCGSLFTVLEQERTPLSNLNVAVRR
jgi:hypothetical protein